MKILTSIGVIIFLALTFVSCEKDINYIQSEREYITENYANIRIKGVYSNIKLDEEYKLIFTKRHAGYIEKTQIASGELYREVPCKSANIKIYSEDFNSSMELEIIFDGEYDDLYILGYDFQKIYNTNNLKVIHYGNGFDAFPIGLRCDIENLVYDKENESLKFNINLHYYQGEAYDFILTGEVSVKLYKYEYHTD